MIKNIFRTFAQTRVKIVTIIFALLLCISLIIVGSFTWFTDHDSILNTFAKNFSSSAKIVEVFTTDQELRSNASVTKEVRIQNNGQTDLVVRVSLDEMLAMLDIDVNTGNLQRTTTKGTEFAPSSSSSWVAGNTVSAYSTDSAGNQITSSTEYFSINSVKQKNGIGYTDADRLADIADYYHITFGDVGTDGTNDWTYSDGYFYYTKEVLSPDATTSALVLKIKSDDEVPNFMKGAYYKLTVNMEGLSVENGCLVDWWSIAPTPGTNAAYDVLYSYCG